MTPAARLLAGTSAVERMCSRLDAQREAERRAYSYVVVAAQAQELGQGPPAAQG